MTDAVTEKVLASFDAQRLMELLPHRYPFLLVDRIEQVDGDSSAVGIKNVTMNEPQFMGHFPGRPIYPGVLLIEGMAQTAGAICVAHTMQGSSPSVVYFMTIDNAKFRKPVVPGDTVEFHLTKTKARSNMWWFKGIAKVRGQTVAEAEVSAMLVKD